MRSFRVRVARACTRKRRATRTTLISPASTRPRLEARCGILAGPATATTGRRIVILAHREGVEPRRHVYATTGSIVAAPSGAPIPHRTADAMQRVGEHPVPVGPLAVRWLAYDLQEPRAGATGRARIRLENAGSAAWRRRGHTMVQLSYHWLDRLGNPIFWDGLRTAFAHRVEPGEIAELEAAVKAPRPPGRYRLAFDLVEEHRLWFEEVGSTPLDIPVEVRPRISERRLAVVTHGAPDPETDAAVAAQEEPIVTDDPVAVAHLVSGARPDPAWARFMLDAHEEGYAAVGPAIEVERSLGARHERARFAPWVPSGRNPLFGHALLMPSLLDGLVPGEQDGIPSFSGGEDALFEGRAVVRLRPRFGRPSD